MSMVRLLAPVRKNPKSHSSISQVHRIPYRLVNSICPRMTERKSPSPEGRANLEPNKLSSILKERERRRIGRKKHADSRR